MNSLPAGASERSVQVSQLASCFFQKKLFFWLNRHLVRRLPVATKPGNELRINKKKAQKLTLIANKSASSLIADDRAIFWRRQGRTKAVQSSDTIGWCSPARFLLRKAFEEVSISRLFPSGNGSDGDGWQELNKLRLMLRKEIKTFILLTVFVLNAKIAS